ncbi:hypothetical protein [Weissella thailandensis]|uniref:hypothetical protein n=1 Tax=Weissella thailandensis TaxID=89061 RepID=UPI0027E45C8C|nr:hypothetical protein [Weissella thailandensis]
MRNPRIKKICNILVVITTLILGINLINLSVHADDGLKQVDPKKTYLDSTEVYMGAPDEEKIILTGSTSYVSNPDKKSDYVNYKDGKFRLATTAGHMRRVLKEAGISLHTAQTTQQESVRIYQIGVIQDLEIFNNNIKLPVHLARTIMNK